MNKSQRQPTNKPKDNKGKKAATNNTTCANEKAKHNDNREARPAQSGMRTGLLDTAPKKEKAVAFDVALFRTYTPLALQANGIDTNQYYTPAQAALYERFFAQLFTVNAYMNLTAIRSTTEAIVKHLVDSLTIASMIPQGAHVLDVGCGGGFPSVPLCIARPDIRIIAFDATAKKVEFVKGIGEELATANLSTSVGRAEEYAHKNGWRESFDVVVSRAVANMAALCQITLPFVKMGGEVIAMKGPNGLQELQVALPLIRTYGGETKQIDWTKITLKSPLLSSITGTPLPCTAQDAPTPENGCACTPIEANVTSPDQADNERTILCIRKAEPTPPVLPGTWAQITKEADKANGKV